MTEPRSESYTFRPAKVEDAATLAALVHEAYQHYIPRLGEPPGPMTLDYERVLRQRDVEVAEVAGSIAAMIVTHSAPDDFVIENVAVSPRHQGHGLGSELLALAEERAQRSGHSFVRLYTHHRMTENRRFYRGHGYVEYQPASGADDVLIHFRKPLRPEP